MFQHAFQTDRFHKDRLIIHCYKKYIASITPECISFLTIREEAQKALLNDVHATEPVSYKFSSCEATAILLIAMGFYSSLLLPGYP